MGRPVRVSDHGREGYFPVVSYSPNLHPIIKRYKYVISDNKCIFFGSLTIGGFGAFFFCPCFSFLGLCAKRGGRRRRRKRRRRRRRRRRKRAFPIIEAEEEDDWKKEEEEEGLPGLAEGENSASKK